MSIRRPTSLVSLLVAGISLSTAWLVSSGGSAAALTAVDDWGAVAKSGQTTLDVLANDTDASGAITIISKTDPTAGSAIVSNGKILYTPNASFTGTDQFEYTIQDGSGATDIGQVHIINIPVAKADNGFLSDSAALRIDVLKNDKVSDEAPNYGLKVSKPQKGSARVNKDGDAVIYQPGPNFAGYDSFQYTIRYDVGVTASASVTVFSPGIAFQGDMGANIADTAGNIVGYIHLTTTTTGAFSGKVQIGTEVYSLLGTLDAKGKFVGYAHSRDNDILALSMKVNSTGSGAELQATFGGSSEWTVTQAVDTLTAEGLKTFEGLYTVELGGADVPTTTDSGNDGTGSTTATTSTSGGSLPQGIGWMTIKVNEYGNATLEGRTGDGRSFSTSGQISGTDSEPEMPFYAAWDDSVLTGTLKIGETIEGDLRWILYPNDEDRYPGGFDVTISATGSRYEEPESGRRVLANDTSDAGRVTISISGGGADSFSREMRLSEGDDVSPIIEGPDEIEFEIDRDNGIFKGKFRDTDDRERRIKFTGVLLQGESRGVGLFEGDNKTGRVEITISTSSDSGTTSGIDLGNL